jgi:hypothetical protein
VFTIKNLKFDYNNSVTTAGDCGVDVHHFDIQTDASNVMIESQNIITDTKIDITPVFKETFGLNLHVKNQVKSNKNNPQPQPHSQLQVAPSNFRNRNANARIYMMRNAFAK